MNLGKIAYPKFLENHEARITRGDALVWAGSCFFSKKVRHRRENDGHYDEVIAKATMGVEIDGLFEGFEGLDFVVEGSIPNTFAIKEAAIAKNPDGSFNHLSLTLLARGLT